MFTITGKFSLFELGIRLPELTINPEFGFVLHVDDLTGLLPEQWLNESLVNFIISLTAGKNDRLDIFFIRSEFAYFAWKEAQKDQPDTNMQAFTWADNLPAEQKGSLNRFVLVLQVADDHWVALDIDIATVTVTVYDSMYPAPLRSPYHQQIQEHWKYFKEVLFAPLRQHERIKSLVFERENWEVLNGACHTQETGGCGIHACLNITSLLCEGRTMSPGDFEHDYNMREGECQFLLEKLLRRVGLKETERMTDAHLGIYAVGRQIQQTYFLPPGISAWQLSRADSDGRLFGDCIWTGQRRPLAALISM